MMDGEQDEQKAQNLGCRVGLNMRPRPTQLNTGQLGGKVQSMHSLQPERCFQGVLAIAVSTPVGLRIQ